MKAFSDSAIKRIAQEIDDPNVSGSNPAMKYFKFTLTNVVEEYVTFVVAAASKEEAFSYSEELQNYGENASKSNEAEIRDELIDSRFEFDGEISENELPRGGAQIVIDEDFKENAVIDPEEAARTLSDLNKFSKVQH